MRLQRTLHPIEELAAHVGVAASYDDAFGERQEISRDRIAALLTILGFGVVDDAAAAASLDRLQAAERARIVEPVAVVGVEAPPAVNLWVENRLRLERWDWTLDLETGERRSGSFVPATIATSDASGERVGEHERIVLTLPATLEPGYAHLRVSCIDVASEMSLIVVPTTCYVPPALDQRGAWGLAVQLYGIRSDRNDGIGDFRDLATLYQTVGAAGGSAVGINPLHELAAGGATDPSPYSPASRLSLNWMYLSVEDLPGFDPIDQDVEALAALRAADLLDYPALVAYKRRAIRLAYDRFIAADPVNPTFADFVRAGGDALRNATVFAALLDDLTATDPGARRWQDWPPEYRDPASPAVLTFARDHATDVGFYAYLQWQADVQLAAVVIGNAPLAIGIYRDLAVGADLSGADTWAYQGLLRSDVAVGAPPDILNRSGQNWGVAPFDPLALRASAYAPFIALLRANMRHAGALRIDHAMLLARLWWIPEGAAASDGAYITYRLDELVGIIALESQRARCIVIGEDLGTVPAGFRERLAAAHILSYRLLPFEADDDGFVAPDRYPEFALVSTTTHDLPTMGSYWSEHDIALRRRVGSIADDAAQARESAARARMREGLLAAFGGAGLATPADRFRAAAAHPEDRETLAAIALTANRYLAATPARLLMVQLEDVLGEVDQANLPGTIDEHPNWRRRSPIDLTAIGTDPHYLRLASAMRAAGRAGTAYMPNTTTVALPVSGMEPPLLPAATATYCLPSDA